MSQTDRIDALVEEILETGRTPEEVCGPDAQLLVEVQARLRQLRTIEAEVDLLFPPSDFNTKFYNAFASVDVALPSIPDYEVQTILGRGGMGIVYKARHLTLNREVALKMLLTGAYASQQEQLRFVREAESVATLHHPNIVQIYGFGEVDGHPYFTMEYVGGGSLAQKLAGRVQSARESAELVSALAQAVQSAHASGIVHRDLKPANILLAGGSPKISDFGLARRLDQESALTMTGARVGTPSYMAPEQMSGRSSALGPGVDIFALGAILYEMLTGHPPFRGETLSDTERKLATEDPIPPSRFNVKVPHDLETICLKCLEKEPRRRYPTAAELAADLERFLRHEPIHSRPIAPAERWVRWVRRNPLPAALVVASLVLVGLIASQATQEWTEAAAARAEKARLTSRIESGVQLVQSGRFAEARAILGKLGDGGFADLRQRIDRILSDLDLVETLEGIGRKRAMALNAHDATWLPNVRAAAEYEALFARAGVGKLTDDPAAIAQRIATSDIDGPLIAALDDWAVCESDEARRNWVLEVAREADVSASEWQNQCRDPAAWADPDVLARLAATAPATNASVQQLRALGDRLAAAGLDATPFRSRIQQDHVDSFLANLSLADALRATDPVEAIRYYQAALAIRPQSATAHNNLGVVLAHLKRSTEAIVQYEQAIKFDPNSPAAEYNVALELSSDRPAEAIPHLERAIELNEKLAAAHRLLGEVLLQQQRYDDATAALQRCLPLLHEETERHQISELIQQCEAKEKENQRPGP